MQLASAVQKRKDEELYGGSKLFFMRAEEGARQFLHTYGAGKALVVSDVNAYKTLARIALSPKALSLVYDGDALALFSMPDGVGSVLCAGGEETLQAARYFAWVRGVPCALFPSSGTLFGALEDRGEITLCGVRECVSLAEPQVYFDLKGGFSLSEAYAQVYLSALARFEQNALADFGVGKAYRGGDIPLSCACPDQVDLITLNASLRCEEAKGAPVGEGRALARAYESDGNKRPVYRAFTELMALYYAFFKCGKPRRYFVCDYAARARAAGRDYAEIKVPSPGEYALRAMTLERVRSQKLQELKHILECWQKSPFCLKQAASLLDLNRLKYLPEYGGGLSAIIRDFGLLG